MTKNIRVPSQKKPVNKLHVANTDNDTIEAFVKKHGPGVVVFESICGNLKDNDVPCPNPIRIQGFTAMNQIKKYGRFQPPTICKSCFDTFRGQHSPRPASNAKILKNGGATRAIPETLSDDMLLKFRKRFEGKPVELKFKNQVSFSTQDESNSPEHGRVMAVSKNGISLLEDGSAVHETRTYALGDLAEIRVITKANPVTAAESGPVTAVA